MGCLFLIQGPLLLAAGSITISDTRLTSLFAEPLELARVMGALGVTGFMGAVVASLAPVSVFVGVGILLRRPWSWLVGMTMLGISLAAGLVLYALGEPDFLALALGVFCVLTLNQDEVRESFRRQMR
ncbi:MAG: hypothetical protein U0821_14690 [Chloroflexota bacterium]